MSTDTPVSELVAALNIFVVALIALGLTATFLAKHILVAILAAEGV